MERRFEVDDVVGVGQVIAVIETDGEIEAPAAEPTTESEMASEEEQSIPADLPTVESVKMEAVKAEVAGQSYQSDSGRFYSPLVKNIAKTEGISLEELEAIPGSGKDQRVTKKDVLAYLENRKAPVTEQPKKVSESIAEPVPVVPRQVVESNDSQEIIEMTRMGKLISKHMTDSLQISAHVQSFVEVDVTNIVKWREKVKDEFFRREGEKITFTPIFMEAVAKALRDYPMMNISVDGDKVIRHKAVHLGMAAALPDGNLIVPVIKHADQLNLVGMAKTVNDLAKRSRAGKLNPDDIQGGTYTVTNVGSFGSIMGTPIINQPQVGILALGSIRKVPAVIETDEGDLIGIRHKMILSHSYDHRVVNGALGSQFAKKVADYLEAWDMNTTF